MSFKPMWTVHRNPALVRGRNWCTLQGLLRIYKIQWTVPLSILLTLLGPWNLNLGEERVRTKELLPDLQLKCVCNTNERRIKNFALHLSLFICLYEQKRLRTENWMDFHKTCYWDVLNKGHYMKTYTRSNTYFEHSTLKTCCNENVFKKSIGKII